MEKTQYRKKAIILLKSILRQREWLIRHDKSYVESSWCREQINNIRYALPHLVDADEVKAYIERKETALRLLIPGTNKKRQEELRELIHEQLN